MCGPDRIKDGGGDASIYHELIYGFSGESAMRGTEPCKGMINGGRGRWL